MGFKNMYFAAEKRYVKAFLSSDFNCRSKYENELVKARNSNGYEVVESGLWDFIKKAYISDEMLLEMNRGNTDELYEPVHQVGLFKAKKYVENFFDINLTKVKIFRAPVHDGADACCLSRGLQDHVVVLPTDGFQSIDLVVHEFSHAAHQTIRRRNQDTKFLWQHAVIHETVAYSVQFRYLLKYGTPNQRKGALGEFLFPYFALNAVGAHIYKDVKWDDLFTHSLMKRFRSIYSDEKIIERIEKLKKIPTEQIYHNIIELRFGIPIALALLESDKSVHRLSQTSISRSVPENLLKLIPNFYPRVLDFQNLDELFGNFIRGEYPVP